MKQHRIKRGFTLIEVLAALGIIIVLTLTLLATIKGQLDRANHQNLVAAAETVNMQIAVAYRQAGKIDSQFTSGSALVAAGIISQEQLDQLEGATFHGGQPPTYVVN